MLQVNYTYIPEGSTVLIANGESIIVSKISAASVAGAAGTVNIFEQDGTTKIADIEIRSGRNFTFEIETGFIAINGISITTPVTVSCTIFYSQGGA